MPATSKLPAVELVQQTPRLWLSDNPTFEIVKGGKILAFFVYWIHFFTFIPSSSFQNRDIRLEPPIWMVKKSAKKRRSAEKRRDDLDKLRGVSLLDSATPESSEKKSSASSQLSEITEANGTGYSAKLPRHRVEFVLPRALGKSRQKYIFDKQKRGLINEDLPTIQEGDDEGSPSRDDHKRANESIDDILFPNKRRKLEKEFETIHKEASEKNNTSRENCSKGKAAARISGGVFMLSRDADGRPRLPEQVVHNSCHRKTNPDTSGETKHHGISRCVSTASIPQSGGKLSGLSVEEAVKDKYGLRPRANSTDGELNLPQRGLCDERKVLEAHRWSQDQSYVHQVMPKGLVNLGNTCFLNATLQCLAYLPPFCQSLLAMSETKTRQQNNSTNKLTQGQRVTATLSSLFQRIHTFSEVDRGGAIAPKSIVKALPTIGTCGSKNGYKFRPGRQEDAHEFLVHLLDAMHDGELRAAGINQQISGWRDRLPVPRLDETTFIHRVFGGYFRSQVRCRKCGYRSNTYDPFLDLSLEVSKKTSRSILHSLADFTRIETLDADNQWRCSGCKKYVRATKQLTVFRPPLSLCIQLKRFTFAGGFGSRGFSSYGTGGGKYGKANNRFGGNSGKITKPIEFPAELELPLSDSRSCEYALTGLVIHVGGSASSGHYTAYFKKPGRKGADQWYHVDDSFVEVVPEKTVLRQKDVYLLFYCRKEVKLEFPSPPLGMSADEALQVGRARAKARACSASVAESTQNHQSAEIAVGSETDSTCVKRDRAGGVPLKRTKTVVHPLATGPFAMGEEMASKQSSPSSSSSSGSSSGESSSENDSSSNSDESQGYHAKRQSDRVEEHESDSSGSEFDLVRPKVSPASLENSSESSSSDKEDEMEMDLLKADVKVRDRESMTSSARSAREISTSTPDSKRREAEISSTESHLTLPTSSDKQQQSESADSNRGTLQEKEHKSNQTRVVVGRSDSRNKIQVMLGPRKRKLWKSKAANTGGKGAAFDLLGNLSVSKWGEGEERTPEATSVSKNEGISQERGSIVEELRKEEKSRKRKHHLDRWDAHLDQGRVIIEERGIQQQLCSFLSLANIFLAICHSRPRKQKKIKRKTEKLLWDECQSTTYFNEYKAVSKR
eukprot:scaffold880_cov132-Cylindrotheca_fusiformis.AAC.78